MAGDNLQESFLGSWICLPFRRKLKKNRSQLGRKPRGSRKKVFQCIVWMLQLFLMGQKATGFHRKNKISRSRLSPIVEGGLYGETIEAVVQLNCVEPLRVKI